MTISELIELLAEAKDTYGDIGVRLYDRNGDRIIEPFVNFGVSSPGGEFAHFSDTEMLKRAK